jgi:hypothetical protein
MADLLIARDAHHPRRIRERAAQEALEHFEGDDVPLQLQRQSRIPASRREVNPHPRHDLGFP